MNQLVNRTYSAVLCLTCREPIPVPPIVKRLRDVAHAEGHEAWANQRVFQLRCRTCGREKPYHFGQVIEVAGEPKVRPAGPSRAAGLSARSRAMGA